MPPADYQAWSCEWGGYSPMSGSLGTTEGELKFIELCPLWLIHYVYNALFCDMLCWCSEVKKNLFPKNIMSLLIPSVAQPSLSTDVCNSSKDTSPATHIPGAQSSRFWRECTTGVYLILVCGQRDLMYNSEKWKLCLYYYYVKYFGIYLNAWLHNPTEVSQIDFF